MGVHVDGFIANVAHSFVINASKVGFPWAAFFFNKGEGTHGRAVKTGVLLL